MEPISAAPQADLGPDIEDVGASTREYVWHKHGILFGAAAALCVSLSVVISYAVYESYVLQPDNFDANNLMWPALPLVGLWALYRYYRSKVQHLFAQQLAADIDFTYETNASPATVSGTFFSLGHSAKLSNVMSGTHAGQPVRVYTYQYTVGYGKNQHTHIYTVFEMDYGATLPHVIVNVPELFAPSDMERVELEGGFNKDFNVYVSKGAQTEVREIFQPDVMQDLVSSFKSFSMEISGKNVYLMQKGALTKKQTFLDMLDLTDHLLDKLIPGLRAAGSDAASVSPHA
jgi:hypothetical protein